MIFSVAYLLVRCLLSCLMVLARQESLTDAEFLVLRHENVMLRRQISRVGYHAADRLWLAVLSRLIPRGRSGKMFTVTPRPARTRSGRARPPKINLAEHQLRRKQILSGLTSEYQIAA